MITDEHQARSFCALRSDREGMVRLERLASMLAEENERQNLVSESSLHSIWQRHFADSLQLLDHAPGGDDLWLDLGSGAGFPGLALAAARPRMKIILVESRKRRVEWLKRAIDELTLPFCRVIGSRLENVDSFPAGVISARAFAPLGKLLQLSARFSTCATIWLLPKGRSAAQERKAQAPSVQAMFHVEQSKTDPGGGILVGKGVPSLP